MKKILNKAKIALAVINKIKQENKPKSIQTTLVVGYDLPARVKLRGEKDGYIPDIAVEYDKETTVYEIELSKEMQVSKWRTLSLYARKFNGSFYLVVPDYLKDMFTHEIEEKDINAGVLYFATGQST